MNIHWFTADVHACGMIRAEYVANEMLKSYHNLSIHCSRNIMESDLQQADLVVFQRSQDMNAFAMMRKAQSLGIKCVYELDDDMLELPDGLGQLSEFFHKPDVRDSMRTLIQYADAIIVSTKTLAGAIQKYTSRNIYVIPNYINGDAWELAAAQKAVMNRDKVVVGWTTSPAHVLEVPVISATLKRVLDDCPNVELLLVGVVGRKELGAWAEDKAYDGRITFVPWMHVSRIPEVMLNIDIGLSPLCDNVFNKSRNNIKWQQYSVLGAPGVYQSGPVYENVKPGETGLIANTAEEWYSGIVKLVQDKELRRQMGLKARLDVLTNWDMRHKFSAWMNVFKGIVDMPEGKRG